MPVPATSHAKPVSGLVGSVDTDTSETCSPACGAGGYHENEAAGRPVAVAAGRETRWKLTALLTPAFPASSDCWARTVYVPAPRPAKVADHVPPERLTTTVWIGAPMPSPAYSCTVTA